MSARLISWLSLVLSVTALLMAGIANQKLRAENRMLVEIGQEAYRSLDACRAASRARGRGL